MGIYRGPGGTGDATQDASSQAVITIQAKDAALVAQAAAETSASNASTSATNAATSATSASTSASSASTYASNASTSATNASSSASSASTSASTATTQAGIATTKASEAATSATNAASSASSASTSATNASNSASAASSAQTAAEAARDATLTAYDNFDDRYLGTKTSDPTVDNDGNALTAGALYFNSSIGGMKVYTGSAWVAAYISGSGYLTSANNLSDLASASTARTNLGLAIGTNVQAWDADLDAIAALAGTTGLLKKTAANTWSLDTTAYTSNLGTVTSMSMTVPTGLTISGSPITSSGTLALSLTAGYSIPTTASQTNWDTAYTDRNKWDGGATGLTAATGRTSLGATTLGSNLFTITNPSAITFPRFNADNTVSSLDAATFRTAIGAGTSSTTGTVTSVAALTLGTTGTDLSSTVATGTTTPVITLNVPTASATNRGALSSTDWSTFNGKQAALVSGTNIKTVNSTSLLGSGDVSVGVTSVTGTAPVVSSGGATPAISMAAANTTTNGYLTSTDWNTFNGKYSVGGALGTPSSGTLTNCTFPTLNQNTTGSAGSVANALTIGTGLKLSSGTTYNGSAAVTLNAVGTVINSQTAAYILVAGDAGKTISITTGGVTINNSVMSAGDIVTIYNNSGSSQTITQGTGVTLQWAGQSSSTTGNRTLGLYGMATVVFISASNAVITGAGLS